MSDLLVQLKDAYSNKRPYPFRRIDGDMAVAPVYAVHAHDVMVLMLEVSNRDARIAELEAALKAALRYIENTEDELGIELDCRFAARAAYLGEKE